MRIHGRVFNRRGDNFVDGDFNITIYEDDGTTLANLYDDDNLVSITINPFNLASDGYVDIFCDPGEYKMQVQGLGRFSRYGIVSETNLEMGAWSPDAEQFGHLYENATPYDVVSGVGTMWYDMSDAIIAGELGFTFFKDSEAIGYPEEPFFIGGDPWFVVSCRCTLTQGAGTPPLVFIGVSLDEATPDTWYRIDLTADPVPFGFCERVKMDGGNKVKMAMRIVATGTVGVSDFHMVIS